MEELTEMQKEILIILRKDFIKRALPEKYFHSGGQKMYAEDIEKILREDTSLEVCVGDVDTALHSLRKKKLIFGGDVPKATIFLGGGIIQGISCNHVSLNSKGSEIAAELIFQRKRQSQKNESNTVQISNISGSTVNISQGQAIINAKSSVNGGLGDKALKEIINTLSERDVKLSDSELDQIKEALKAVSKTRESERGLTIKKVLTELGKGCRDVVVNVASDFIIKYFGAN